jgi:hypothetical protein
MNWQAVAAIAAIAATNVAVLKWLFDRHDTVRHESGSQLTDLTTRIFEVEKSVLRLRADLPLEYVRREDWIRFGNTLEAKLDALRAEFRAEMGELKGKIDARRD